MIEQKCSNCGKYNLYYENEWKGRELTKCEYCGHELSICYGFGVVTSEE